MTLADCYKLLELPDGASHSEVKAARRRLLMQWHPDKVAHNPAFQETALEQSKQINMAADFLTSQPDPTSDYARQRDQERAAETARAERERQEAENRRQRQADEEVKQRQQREAEERRQQEALAAEQRARQEAQQEVEAAQRAEQLRHREAAKQKKAVRSRFWWGAVLIVIILYRYTVLQAHQTPTPMSQQVYADAQREATPPASANSGSQTVESNTNATEERWQEVSENWSESDSGKILIGIPRTQAEGAIGQPTLKFRRPDGLSEEMWFTPNSRCYISIVLQNDEVAQVETVISTPGGDLMPGAKSVHLSEVKKDHPNLQVSAYGYDSSKYVRVDGHDAETAYDEETKHFQGNAVTYYYDDVQSGIAFAFGVQDYFDKNTQIEKTIVHVPGVPVFPASNGKSQPPIDEVPDATHPPSS